MSTTNDQDNSNNNNRFEELPPDPPPPQPATEQDSAEPGDEEPFDRPIREATSLKELGNIEFNKQRWRNALELYSQALAALPLPLLAPPPPVPSSSDDQHAGDINEPLNPLDLPSQAAAPLSASNHPSVARLRSVLNANAAACYLKLDDWQAAVHAADASLQDQPAYAKALHRRAHANEKLGTWASLQAALADYGALAGLPDAPPGLLADARAAQARLPPRIARQSAADKDEMLGKLKHLGNSLLGKLGLSTDNFSFVPNATGGYSMSFQQ